MNPDEGFQMTVRNYRDLVVWQRAMDFAEHVYRMTAKSPVEERYALTSQMRRAAVSIPSNIAEGQGLHADRAFRRHLSIAHGSLCEVETQFLLAARLEYIDHAELSEIAAAASEVGRLIMGLTHAVSGARA
jgi:four helix bundle protein